MSAKPVTPQEIKGYWDKTPKPSVRKVADVMKAAGRKVSAKTVGKWLQKNWGDTPEHVAKTVEKAAEKIETANAVAQAMAPDDPDEIKPPKPLPENATRQDKAAALLDEQIDLARVATATLTQTAPRVMLATPELVTKAFKDLASGIESVFDVIGRMPATVANNGDGAKVVNGQELILPPRDRPLREILAEFKKKDAA